MNKLIKSILNGFLELVFIFVKDNDIKAKIFTRISKLLFDKHNNLEYDASLRGFWLKNDTNYLFLVKKPYFNFSKKNLYKSINDIYCKNYIPSDGDIIIDVGAGIGTETLYFHEHIGENGWIYSVEASRDSCNKLNALCIKNNIKNSFNFNIAISNFNGEIWLEETENFEVNQINNIQKGIKINCFTLDQFVMDNNIKKIDLLKVNIEGAELEMIDGMKEVIKITNNIAVSCHDFLFEEKRNIKEKMINFLNANGFELSFNQSGNKVTDSWVYGKRK